MLCRADKWHLVTHVWCLCHIFNVQQLLTVTSVTVVRVQGILTGLYQQTNGQDRWWRQTDQQSDWEAVKQTDSQTDRQSDGQTGGQTDIQSDRQIIRQTVRQTDGQTDIQSDRHIIRQTDGQTDGQTDRWSDRWSDRQAVRQTDRRSDNWFAPDVSQTKTVSTILFIYNFYLFNFSQQLVIYTIRTKQM